MGEIKAGVIFKSRFCSPTKKTFGDYINYIDRDEAVRMIIYLNLACITIIWGIAKKQQDYLQRTKIF